MPIATLAIMVLATWRLSSLLSREDGPYNMLSRLRGKLGVVQNVNSEPYGTNEFARGLLCMWCNSVWVAAVMAIMACVIGLVDIRMVLYAIFALSAGAILVEEVLQWLEQAHPHS